MSINSGLRIIDAEDTKSSANQSTNDLRQLLSAFVKHEASDLHVKANRPPVYRIGGKLVPAKSSPLSEDDVKHILFPLMTKRHLEILENEMQCDFSFNANGMGRFRINIFRQRGTYAAAIRRIPHLIPLLENLSLPPVLMELAMKEQGMILVTGSTGSGKSTTMAALIDYINRNRRSNIITIEDPIEYIHGDKKSTIVQREVGTDVRSINSAIIGSLRQDPDVIAVGEMRDCDSITSAITAAETGHLVLSTLHTNDAKSSVDRIVDVFASNSKEQIRFQLSTTLLAVVSQMLIARKDGSGLVPVCEVMINSPTVSQLIRKNQLDKIGEAMAASNTYYKMQTFNQSLEALVLDGTVSIEEALKASHSPDDLKMRLSGLKREEGY